MSLSLRQLFFCMTVSVVAVAGELDAACTESLCTPDIPIAAGTAVVGGGIGLFTQPGVIEFDVPDGAEVLQVLVYWNGFDSTGAGDNSILVNGLPVVGTRIGGPTLFFTAHFSSTYRADITELGLVAPGVNSISIGGLDFNQVSNGASIIAVIDDGSPLADIQFRDGQDLAFFRFAPPLDATVAQVYEFEAADAARTAEILLFAGSVQGPASGSDPIRPNVCRVTIDGEVTTFMDVFASRSGLEWDHLVLEVEVPAGATSMTVQMFSETDGTTRLPASLSWLAAILTLPVPPTELPCTAVVGDLVWLDEDGDGIQDAGEPGIQGVVLHLLDSTGTEIATTTTNASGRYEFTVDCEETYTIEVEPSSIPEGLEPSPCNAGLDDAVDNDCSPATVTLPPGVLSDLTIDFGYHRAPYGGDGCTPGYWKQKHHFGNWTYPYKPTTCFSTVFGCGFPKLTLLQVLELGGGDLNAIGRHAVAALLSAASADVDYDLTVEEVIALFRAAYKGSATQRKEVHELLEFFNEQGCPLDRAPGDTTSDSDRYPKCEDKKSSSDLQCDSSAKRDGDSKSKSCSKK